MKTKPQHKLVLFDIDGTLLKSNDPILRERFSYAMEKVYGVQTTVDWTEEGLTDTTIFSKSLSRTGLSNEQIEEKLPLAFEAIFEHFSQNITQDYAESILPGAKEILDTLQDQVYLGLLTGNYEKVGWHKVQHVGLKDYFSFGVFGHEAHDRNSLARLVHDKAKKFFGFSFEPDDVYIIGDTPSDIACAREIHAHAIVVPTGKYSEQVLLVLHPDLLVKNLLDPRIIKFILGK